MSGTAVPLLYLSLGSMTGRRSSTATRSPTGAECAAERSRASEGKGKRTRNGKPWPSARKEGLPPTCLASVRSAVACRFAFASTSLRVPLSRASPPRAPLRRLRVAAKRGRLNRYRVEYRSEPESLNHDHPPTSRHPPLAATPLRPARRRRGAVASLFPAPGPPRPLPPARHSSPCRRRGGRRPDHLRQLLPRAEQGRFPVLHGRDELWKLLVTITVRHAAEWRQRETRVKRGGGDVRGHSAFAVPEDSSAAGDPFDRVVGKCPTPASRRPWPSRASACWTCWATSN